MTFIQKLEKIVNKNKSLLCIGLDPIKSKVKGSFFEFNRLIIDKTYKYVCAYKPNSAFYEGEGEGGIEELKKTFDYIKDNYPDIPIILDAKRGDIESTNKGYVAYAFDFLKADAVTLNPYVGKEALLPFLERKDEGAIILCKTSNKGSGEFQNLKTGNFFLYEHIALKVAREWNKNNNCLLVVGATYPTELKRVRAIAGEDLWLLVPGIGIQGGNIRETVLAGQNKKGKGIIINSSRSILFAKDPEEEAKKLRKEINKHRHYER